jgi:predicted nucleic acid-binding protein
MLHLLDTNIIIQVLRGSTQHRELLVQLVRVNHTLASCSITITEVYSGMRSNETTDTSLLVDSLQFLPTTPKVAENAGLLKRHWASKGHTISLPDITIAAVAIEYHCMLVTENIKDFPMPELMIYRQ